MTGPEGFVTRMALFAFVAAFFFSVCPAAADEVLLVGGTGTGIGTMRLLKVAFERRHPDITIRMLPSLGSSGAIRALAKGALDIGVISRTFTSEELRLGLQKLDFARTPFVFVANKAVPESNLSGSRVEEILSGRIATWPSGDRIRLILRPAADSDTKAVRETSPGIRAAIDNLLGRKGMLVALTNQECLELVEKTPGSLGFTSLAQVVSEERNIKILSFNGVRPSLSTLDKGAYPLSQTLSIITRGPASTARKSFIDFVASPEGERIIQQAGSIPLKGKPRG